MGRWAALLSWFAIGCGRIGFDGYAGTADAANLIDTPDAPPPDVMFTWAVTPTANNQVVAWAVATDAASNVYVSGFADGDVDLGGGNLAGTNRDLIFASYDPTGAFRFGDRFGGPGSNQARGIAVGPSGAVYVG